MYRQPSRWERRIAEIEAAAQQGKFVTNLFLYPTEYRKLDAMGFTLEEPILPFNNSQSIKVSWDNINEYFLDSEKAIYDYCLLQTDEFPETSFFADECFIKAFRFNLKNCADPVVFLQILKNFFERNSWF